MRLSSTNLRFGDLITVPEYETLAREFAAGKDAALVGEAGGCAVYLLTESCHLRHGESCWVMEANKLWRACVKKAKARRRSSVQRRWSTDSSFLAEELHKCARRLFLHRLTHGGEVKPLGNPGGVVGTYRVVMEVTESGEPKELSPKSLLESPHLGFRFGEEEVGEAFEDAIDAERMLLSASVSPQWLDSGTFGVAEHKDLTQMSRPCKPEEVSLIPQISRDIECHKVSEPSESSTTEQLLEITELQDELRRLKQQLSKQAQLANAHEAEIRRLRESKYELLKMTSNAEAKQIQILWRRTRRAKVAVVVRGARMDTAAITVQASFRRAHSLRTYEIIRRRRLEIATRAVYAVQRLGRHVSAKCAAAVARHAAAVRLQALARGAAMTRGTRLKRAALTARKLRCDLDTANTAAIILSERLSLARAAHAIDRIDLRDLTETAFDLAGLAANGAVAAAECGDFTPAAFALQTNVRGVVLPTLVKIRSLAWHCPDARNVMIAQGMVSSLNYVLCYTPIATHASAAAEILSHLARCDADRLVNTGAIAALVHCMFGPHARLPNFKDHASDALVELQKIPNFITAFRHAFADAGVTISEADANRISKGGLDHDLLEKIALKPKDHPPIMPICASPSVAPNKKRPNFCIKTAIASMKLNPTFPLAESLLKSREQTLPDTLNETPIKKRNRPRRRRAQQHTKPSKSTTLDAMT